ncbi:hypothetical protein JTB14_013440 [Gonioctena quinquepunctata]|nr:hypothetical protein JTB14_013440 [Gonioctena quinquepunctata]
MGHDTVTVKKVGTRQEQVIHVNRLKPYYGEVQEKLPEEIWTGLKNTQEKLLKEKMGDEDEEILKERIRRKNRRKKIIRNRDRKRRRGRSRLEYRCNSTRNIDTKRKGGK